MLILEIAVGVFLGLYLFCSLGPYAFSNPTLLVGGVVVAGVCYAGVYYIAPFVIGVVWAWIANDPKEALAFLVVGGVGALIIGGLIYGTGSAVLAVLQAVWPRLRR
jgi:hypothetical protein